MKEECPIGLICEYFDGCSQQTCYDYAAPIVLPYRICDSDDLYREGTFVCQLPEFEEDPDCDESEVALTNRYERNLWIARIRAEMEAEGWGGICELPYSYNASMQALVVHSECFLEGEDLGFDPAEVDVKGCIKGGFIRALPLDLHFIPTREAIQMHLDTDGFCYSSFLIWDEYYEFDM